MNRILGLTTTTRQQPTVITGSPPSQPSQQYPGSYPQQTPYPEQAPYPTGPGAGGMPVATGVTEQPPPYPSGNFPPAPPPYDASVRPP